MKKARLKRVLKKAKKRIRENIRLTLLARLSELAVEFNQDSGRFKKIFRKSANQLSKRLSGKIAMDSLTLPDSNNPVSDDQLKGIS